MAKPELRIVRDAAPGAPSEPAPAVAVKFGDLFPLLAYAQRHGYHWVKDFADDEVLVTADLAQLLGSFAAVVEDRRRA
ncbi:MAG: hypothetical protein ACRC1K_11170 [Planctomycetia bacterium]